MSGIPKWVDAEIRTGLNHAYWGGGWEGNMFKRLNQYGLLDKQGDLNEKGMKLRDEIINTSEITMNLRRFRRKHPNYKASMGQAYHRRRLTMERIDGDA